MRMSNFPQDSIGRTAAVLAYFNWLCARAHSKLIIPPAPKPPPRAKPPTVEPPASTNDEVPTQPCAATGKSAAGAGGGGAGGAGGNLPNGTRVRVVRSYAGQVLPREEVRTGETTSLAHGWYYCLMDDNAQVSEIPQAGTGRHE
jgi:hypothetical protein